MKFTMSNESGGGVAYVLVDGESVEDAVSVAFADKLEALLNDDEAPGEAWHYDDTDTFNYEPAETNEEEKATLEHFSTKLAEAQAD